MKTLDEHNKERSSQAILAPFGPTQNGIECPDCQQELYDTHAHVTLMSNPPKKKIHCTGCGFVGYRIA